MKFKKLLALILSLILIMTAFPYSVGVSAATVGIPNDAIEFNGHYYKKFDIGMNWEDAKLYCEDLGGHLLIINSRNEQVFLNSILRNAIKNNYWLGGSLVNGVWKWVDGNNISGYTNWAKGQPDRYLRTETCLMVYNKKNPSGEMLSEKTWNDLSNDGTCDNQPFFGLKNFGFICEWDSETAPIKQQISNIEFGPYALQGATISILGYDIPLIDIEANITLNLSENLKIIADEEANIKVLVGFDENSSANIQGSSSSPTYWSDSYREVKAMYQDLTGKKVDTTRLWNKFSSLRGKLKKINANMVVDVSASLAGYIEFENTGSGYSFSDGGIIAAFDAATSLRSYWGPCYVALGIEAGVEGSLTFTNENNKINPQISVSPSFTLSVGAGIGGRKTYAQVDAYGTLSAMLTTTNPESPFSAGLDLGVRWMGYLFGKEIFSGSKSFTSMELYPEFGTPWQLSRLALMPDIDVSDKESYNALINSAQPISRDYLSATYSLRSTPNLLTNGVNFLKNKAYPLNQVNMVSFEDDTMLLVWIEDSGDKIVENIGTLTYSYFNGEEWSQPESLFEDGTTNDMPYVYSDGKNAYIIWQKANKVFDERTDTSEMLKYFDLYVTVFDSHSQTFTDKICVNSADDTVFEFNPVIYGNNGAFTVAWNENTDNNIYQMSGTNSFNTYSFDENGNLINNRTLRSSNQFINMKTTSTGIYFSLLRSNNSVLYHYDTSNTLNLLATGINAFDCAQGNVFYSDSQGLHSISSDTKIDYTDIGSLDNFIVCKNENQTVLFMTKLNEDFTNTLYFSKLSADSNEWSNFEIYCNENKYIRNYEPVILSDNSIYSVFNYIESNSINNSQISSIAVNPCTENVDIELKYVDFDDFQLNSDNIDIKAAIKNNCSSTVDSFVINILDYEKNIIFSKIIEQNLTAFEEKAVTFNYTVPSSYNNEILTIEISPLNLQDLNLENNYVMTTFECIHRIAEDWNIDILPTVDSCGSVSHHCMICDKPFDTLKLGDTNHDNKINSLDLVNLRCDLLLSVINYLDYITYDANGDGAIDARDLVRLKKILANINVSSGS